uniref:K(+) efflux antiporter chloroplastic-like n=1 Tax=Tetraselmis sp. GSL018 TaxID=582737 RepID=A0A061RBT4_9CHLO
MGIHAAVGYWSSPALAPRNRKLVNVIATKSFISSRRQFSVGLSSQAGSHAKGREVGFKGQGRAANRVVLDFQPPGSNLRTNIASIRYSNCSRRRLFLRASGKGPLGNQSEQQPASPTSGGGDNRNADAGTVQSLPEGKALQVAADEVMEALEETSADKKRIVELLDELKKAREEEDEAENVRMALEAEAQQLGSLAMDAKAEFHKASAMAAKAAEAAQEAVERRNSVNEEVTIMRKQLQKEFEALSKLLASEQFEGEAAGDGKSGSVDDDATQQAKSSVKRSRSAVKSLEETIEAKTDELFVSLMKEIADLESQAETLQQRALALEVAMTNAESLAASAMEAAASGVTREIECADRVKAIEGELQAIVKHLREQAEKAHRAKAKAKAQEESGSARPRDADGAAARSGTAGERAASGKQPGKKGGGGTTDDDDDDILRDVEMMEDLVYKSICEEHGPADEGGAPSKSDDRKSKEPEVSGAKAPKASKSSKFFPGSFFSSGPGPGEVEERLPDLKAAYRNRFAILTGVLAVLLLAGLVQRNFFAAVFSHAAEACRAPVTALAAQLADLPRSAAEVALRFVPEGLHIERGVIDMLVLLCTSVISVPLVMKLPGGSAVLGFLAGGALIGPNALGLIQEVHAVQYVAEFGVVFLLFNIGLELSLDRLRNQIKYVFGLGAAQYFGSTAVIAISSMLLGLHGPAAVIVGGSLALSSTAVALQVLSDRGENGSRHGRATFAVLLLQDLAVVALLMLIPLLAPKTGGASVGLGDIASALGLAAIKAVVCITVIISVGRAVLRPIFRKIADVANAEIFAATTLLTCIGTSLLTQIAGLSMALGAFLAGLLIAETEFALQVESDIAPYRGLLLGLFFMTVGMEVSFGLFLSQWKIILAGIAVLVIGKTLLMTAVGPVFGLTRVAAARAGFLLAPGGEFAFVAFGEAVAAGIVSPALSNQLFVVVALSMALTPYLAAFGQALGSRYEQVDTKALVPQEGEVDDLRGHVIIVGFGRVGMVLAQIFAERLIPFVALDVRAERVTAGRAQDLPVFFGDAGSAAVLHSVGAHRASCAVVALDSAAANYRAVWGLSKNFPNIRTYVRAHDVEDGIHLEQAGAHAVVPEILEPSLQLAAAVLGELKMPADEVSASIDNFRRNHLSDLRAIAQDSGTSLGYGYSSAPEEADSAKAKDSPDGLAGAAG